MTTGIAGVRIHITGIVQGVGFRPFVYGLARRLALTGWVRNTSAGVDIEVDGPPEALLDFTEALRAETPPLARIDRLEIETRPPNGFGDFQILHSEPVPGAFIPISPDVCICPDCLRELFDPADRRYRYPFINCTNCGPRFTITTGIPYDRPNTTMAGFPLCPDCAAEYANPLDRRFHAQPVACPVCGPQVWLEKSDEPASRTAEGDAALHETRRLLKAGKILAIKGLGGFHLACDALNQGAVAELRRRKLRVEKPFALMAPDLETVERHCLVSAAERELLESRARPIVLLRRRPGSPITPAVAPNQDTLGVMLPYTPLHYLLFAPAGPSGAGSPVFEPLFLVMTSGNRSEEPIAYDNEEARQRLSGLADVFLMHDRPIHVRCDDSVVRLIDSAVKPGDDFSKPGLAVLAPIRRSRGYAPDPVRLPFDSPAVLAAGAELKNAFGLARGEYAFLSHHIGDLENYETLRSFEEGISHFERLFKIQPEILACDLHPDYLATRYAQERSLRENLPLLAVQHHHAHIAACMAENGLGPGAQVIGVALDGTGYGTDGHIWGGEFLVCGYTQFTRAAHLIYLPLPGGDRAIREPWRIALAWLHALGLPWQPGLPPVRHARSLAEQRPNPGLPAPLQVLERQLAAGANTPLTSSMGRLFDAVAALAGVRQEVNYEAQAAIELEAALDPAEQGVYRFDLKSGPSDEILLDPTPLFQAVLEDLHRGTPRGRISARFHNSVAQVVVQVCERLRDRFGLAQVALSGGVWQNMALMERAVPRLQERGFTVLLHHRVPANDGGIALGQIAVAASSRAG